jgi:8-oxo-dGTP pyrophosphatase MutT (NUDIX family)
VTGARRRRLPAARAIRELLDGLALTPPPPSSAQAAVLVVVRPATEGEEVEVLLIERAVREGDPGSGQVGLPGGHVHEGDSSLRETALRESEEEVGIGPLDLSEIPRYAGTEFARAFGLSVAVFAAPLAPGARMPGARDAEEVAGVFWLPTSKLSEGARVARTSRAGTIEVDATLYEGHVLWGFTRRILRQLFGEETGVRPDPPAWGDSPVRGPSQTPP